MARADVGQVATDAAIVVAGGSLLDTYLVGNVAQLQSMLANIPDVMGISLRAILLGAVALFVVKKYIMK